MSPRPLDAYGVDYEGDAGGPAGPADQAIRAGDRYVLRHDPLRARVLGPGGEAAEVRLGVDPGAFFCAHHFATLIDLVGAPPLEGRARVGFVHVPPDRAAGPAAAAAPRLHPRAVNLEQIARVIAVACRGLAAGPGDRSLLITGFGAFQGIADNPTAAYVGEPRALARTVALASPGAASIDSSALDEGARVRAFRLADGRRLHLATATLALGRSDADALAGRYIDPERAAADLRRAIEAASARCGRLDAVIGLGVDSTQALGGGAPTFKVEVQTRGWGRGGRAGPLRRDLALAEVFLRARELGDELLVFDDS
ncbi:MAG: hypothetical protein R3B09_06415 [Nannocystaceae bacterium]